MDYELKSSPAIFYSSYSSVYDCFIKAIYTEGYKIRYEDIDSKSLLDKNTKIIKLQRGLNKRIHLLETLNIYVKDVSSNRMEESMLKYVISHALGINIEEDVIKEFKDWYCNQNMFDVDHLLQLVVDKGRKFINNFNRFYDLERENELEFSDNSKDVLLW